MSVDRLSNMISSIKNSSMTGRDVLEIPFTLSCESVAKVLKQKGFIEDLKVFKKEGSSMKMLKIQLSKEGNVIKLSEAKRVSKPGRRIYKSAQELKPVLQGLGIMIVSTSRGVMDGQEAKKKKLGGEVICEVY